MTEKTSLTEVSPEPSANSAPGATSPVPTPVAAPDAASPAAPETHSASEAPLTTDQLEREGDIAADYIEEFLDICDLDGDIDIDARNGRAYLSVKASDADNLRVLSKPETVNALQELTRLAVQNKTGSFSRLILDIGGSREVREAELAALVARAIERIVGGATEADLPAMSSYERKLVHDIVAASGGYRSESSGEGRDRHTVITAA
ncbi:R3H domain-containing nucleic acid-binding protein [Cryobacterium sp. PH29-G1]|uniref:Jag family protein n=1 Tax=Cryobacterium sp. PH29-G1 TaxID=3046211 RepID=UPI0024BB0315|nr:R3H domain-containing nucleic acid-binding protein [Cryobacterium sp. PH29-G1]MDJ0348708.1 R3H domain-containing nucleic acid-binding protein [Cryobacterium sp. PH29-G1]